MRKFNFVPGVLLLSLAFAGAGAARPQEAASPQAAPSKSPATLPLQSFSSPDGRFSVMFPGKPDFAQDSIKLKGSDTTTIYEFTVSLDNDNISYLVMYNDYPPGYAEDGAAAVLERTRDGAVKDKTLTSDVAIDLNGVPGRAFTASDKDGYLYTVHQFLSGKRMYQLIVVSRPDHPAVQTEEFLNSFRIQ